MLDPLLEKRPTRKAFILMAELAKAETGDRGRVREAASAGLLFGLGGGLVGLMLLVAAVAWSMLLVGSSAVGFVLGRVLREPALQSSLSVWDAGRVLVYGMIGKPAADGSMVGAAALFAVLLTALGLMTRRSFRVAEVVG